VGHEQNPLGVSRTNCGVSRTNDGHGYLKSVLNCDFFVSGRKKKGGFLATKELMFYICKEE